VSRKRKNSGCFFLVALLFYILEEREKDEGEGEGEGGWSW